jgi:hypothetical protein
VKLEYRLDDENQNFPSLWYYADISTEEVTARMTCEYFVKAGETFVVTATAMEPDGTAVLYVKKENFPNDTTDIHYSHIGLEVRELRGRGSTLLEKKELWEHEEVLPTLHCDYLYIYQNGKFLEFALDSREIDEDRKCYVYYGEFTGNSR